MVVFSSFIRPSYDIDILPLWIKHYLSYGFDRYVVFLHDVEGEEGITWKANFAFWQEGFEVVTVRGEYQNGALQALHLDKLRKSLSRNDRLVVADSDEFHNMPLSYKYLCTSSDIIKGVMIDRWNKEGLFSGGGIKPIECQYPEKGDLFKHLKNTYPSLDDSYFTSMPHEKILSFRPDIEVNMNGCHIYNTSEPLDILNDREIFHYTWRKGILHRMAGKSYYSIRHIVLLCDFFKINQYDSEIIEVKDILEKRMIEMEKIVGSL